MRILIATIIAYCIIGFSGCNETGGPEKVAVVSTQYVTKDQLEEDAWDKTPSEVRTNLGPPTAVRHRDDGEWWFYNHIQLRYDDGGMKCPQIHFKDGKWVSIGYTAPDKVESFMRDDHWFSVD